MVTAADYLALAKECREKALSAATEEEKAKWQELADAWTQLSQSGIVTPPDAPKPLEPS